jgi:hypothetical protein
VKPERNAWSPLHGEDSDFCKNTFGALRSITTQHATSYETVVLCQAQVSGEVTLSSGEGAPSNVSIHSGREGDKGGKKRCMQHLQGAMMTTTMGRWVALA